MNQLRQRMYVMVARSLSPIQKGIQALHAVVAYQVQYGDTKEYKRWSQIDETVILLDGGTSNRKEEEDGTFKGTLDNTLQHLTMNDLKTSGFWEEDTNDMLTAVAILADERVWDKVKYPDFIYSGPSTSFFINPYQDAAYKQWVDDIGGDNIVYLREFLGNMKTAN